VLVTPPVLFYSLGHRCIQPVDNVALLHLTHVEEDVFAHLDVLPKGQVGHKQPPAGALRTFNGEALRRGMLPQLVGSLLQAGEMQRPFQFRQLCFTIDIYKMIFVLEPLIRMIRPPWW
jgi:hypothetical protein